jgi:arylesterase / paraoxonase
MKKRILVTLLILSLLVAAWVFDLLWSAGQFKTIEPHFAGKCNPVVGLIGAEDITIHPQTGIAYISACDRRAVSNGQPGNGGIYAYDLNRAAPEPVLLTPDAAKDFQPHGISLYVAGNGLDALFAVNHQGGKQAIEIYDLTHGELSHRRTVTDPLLVSPNDLVAVGPDQFYVTNDHRYVAGARRMLEEYLRLRLSNVVFYNGSEFVEVATGIGYANGINLSADGRTLFLCAVTERALHLYDRDPATNRLTLREKIKLNTGVDNIEVDPEGGLWIGAHPKLLSFVKHSQDPSQRSPSQILHLIPRPDGGYAVEEIYLNAGEEISGSSVGAVRNNRLLIGAVFDPKFLDCQRE